MKEQTLLILACPICHHLLQHDKQKNKLICQHDRSYFLIKDQIPVLLPELAIALDETRMENAHEI